MAVIKFNEKTINYPIVLVPDKLLDFFTNHITSEQILNYIDVKIPEFDPSIKTSIQKDFYQYSYGNGGNKNDNTKEIEEFKKRFPNYKIIYGQGLVGQNTTTYTAIYKVNEIVYFSAKNNYNDYYIGKYLLPQKPLDYIKVTRMSKNWGCFFPILLLCLIILFLTYQLDFNAFLFMAVSFCAFLFFYIPKIPNSVENVDEIKKTTLDYDTDLKQFIQQIENIRAKYKSEITKEQLLVKKIADENRIHIEPKILLDKLKPNIYALKKTTNEKRGKSELFFLTRLYERFSSQIQVDVVPAKSKNPFQPDFVLICGDTGFHINIEIDEPYSVDNGKPIHHDRTTDEDRNTFFLEINWGIIRFTERQIIENSEECISLIQNVVDAVKNKQNYFEHNVPLQKKWSYEEALIMSNNAFRNTYLPNNMKVNIQYKKAKDDIDNNYLPF